MSILDGEVAYDVWRSWCMGGGKLRGVGCLETDASSAEASLKLTIEGSAICGGILCEKVCRGAVRKHGDGHAGGKRGVAKKERGYMR